MLEKILTWIELIVMGAISEMQTIEKRSPQKSESGFDLFNMPHIL